MHLRQCREFERGRCAREQESFVRGAKECQDATNRLFGRGSISRKGHKVTQRLRFRIVGRLHHRNHGGPSSIRRSLYIPVSFYRQSASRLAALRKLCHLCEKQTRRNYPTTIANTTSNTIKSTIVNSSSSARAVAASSYNAAYVSRMMESLRSTAALQVFTRNSSSASA